MRKAVLVLLLFTACAGSVVRNFAFRAPGCKPSAPDVPYSVRYLGSGGVYIKWKDDGLLVGPYFSHSGGVVAAQFGHGHFDDARIDSGMSGITNVRAILFGHSHFDHFGDVPRIADKVPAVPSYANASGVKLLGGYPKTQSRAVSVEGKPSIDVPGAAIRIIPIKWDHAPQLCRWNHWPCTYAIGEAEPQTKAWEKVPLRALRNGQTYAYEIDLMNGSEVAHRIYYNDAAAAEQPGVPDGPFDLAIICVASYDLVSGYPESLLARLKPRHVLISHYEDFFVKQKTNSWTF